MTICALGLNHNSAPLSVRERLAFPADILATALSDLIRVPEVNEAAILSTCNRTEFYCGINPNNQQKIVDWIAHNRSLSQAEFRHYLYFYTDTNSIRHLFRVASGLDSMVLGEPQILGQMKSAYEIARETGAIGKHLGKLFQYTFAAAKKVRTDTAIGSSPVSVAFAAVRLAQQIFDTLSEQTALLIGAGETIELTARHFHENKIGRLIVANRTFNKARFIANQFNGNPISLSELPNHLPKADIIVSSTASQLPILGKGSIESAIKLRKHKPIFMVDLAIPRDIEPEVSKLSDVYLYSIDDLKNTIEENFDSRRKAAQQAEEIIDSEIEHYLAWTRSQIAVTTIHDFRSQAELLRDQQLKKALENLANGATPEKALASLAHSLTNKLLHVPTIKIRQAGIDERHDLISAAKEIFQLKKSAKREKYDKE